MPQNGFTEKREHPRVSFNWPVTLIHAENDPIYGSVRNIGRTGALIYVEAKLEINDQVRFAIEVSEFDDVILGIGKVSRVKKVLEFKKHTSSNTYAIGIHFTKLLTDACKYFTGNLAEEWQSSYRNLTRLEGSKLNNEHNAKVKTKYHYIKYGLTFVGILGLAVLVVFAVTALYPKSPPIPERAFNSDEFQLFSDRVNKEIALLHNTTQMQAAKIAQLEDQLSRQDNNIPLSANIDEISSSLRPLIDDLYKTKSGLENQPLLAEPTFGTQTQISNANEDPSIYHTVSAGETIYSISKKYKLTVEELLKINKIPENTTIYVEQKLRIKG